MSHSDYLLSWCKICNFHSNRFRHRSRFGRAICIPHIAPPKSWPCLHSIWYRIWVYVLCCPWVWVEKRFFSLSWVSKTQLTHSSLEWTMEWSTMCGCLLWGCCQQYWWSLHHCWRLSNVVNRLQASLLWVFLKKNKNTTYTKSLILLEQSKLINQPIITTIFQSNLSTLNILMKNVLRDGSIQAMCKLCIKSLLHCDVWTVLKLLTF